MRNFIKMPKINPERIEKITIPDDDMMGWIKTLRDSGLREEEIDEILSHLNETYRIHKKPTEKELKKVEDYLKEKYGRELSEEQREYIRNGIESRMKDKKEQ